jgi:hypothetical protein
VLAVAVSSNSIATGLFTSGSAATCSSLKPGATVNVFIASAGDVGGIRGSSVE